jgi:hypothetical protein
LPKNESVAALRNLRRDETARIAAVENNRVSAFGYVKVQFMSLPRQAVP